MMSTHWFYARGFGISHISTLTRIFLDLRTTDIPCDLIRLHKPLEVFNILTFPWSKCPADMSAISKDSIMCSHIVHHYTFKYLTQATHTLQHIWRTFAGMHTNILSHLQSFRCTIPHLRIFFLSEACLLRIFDIIHTHTMQTAYRIFKDLRTSLPLLPQHSKHDWYASPKVSIVQEHTQAHTPAFIHSHHSGLFVHTFWSLALPLDQSSSTAIFGLHSLN